MEELYVKSPIDARDITKGKAYKVLSGHEEDLVRIKDDNGDQILILTEKSKHNCPFLNYEHKCQFCDKEGNDINK